MVVLIQPLLVTSNLVDVFSAGTFNSSNNSPLGSAPRGTNVSSGRVLTADGFGNSSWISPTADAASSLHEVTTAGADTTNAVILRGGIRSSMNSDEKFGFGAMENSTGGLSSAAFGYNALNAVYIW